MPTRRMPHRTGRGGTRSPGGYGRRQRPMFGVGRPRSQPGMSGAGGSARAGMGRSAMGRGAMGRGGAGGLKMRLLIALALAAFALISYYGNPGDVNQITGERERVAMPDEAQEMALGRQAAPQMVQQHRGPSRDPVATQRVERIGRQLLAALEIWIAEKEAETGLELRNPYEFQFTLLADPQTVNAFALPGGPCFITEALYSRLQTDGELAGVIGHEIGHVIDRHGNERMAKQKLFGGLAAAGGVVGGGQNSARVSQQILQMVQMKYGRDDELESDRWGVILCEKAGYDPRAMIGVMKVLDEASPSGGPPEMMSTHPKPANRIAYIQQVIKQVFPEGVRPGLKP